ncbi:hypothetical protein GGX14DRAFT_347590 [Mycena pura]|uniref:Integrase catalytic domain-containing protein n=1 Tax=Mycena pura TaxID=153505 RepID=A0AAD6YRB9_9AGAR|nr:hypothetical protein GGX14DRAFT_347590 [Mycena pura]
MVNKEGANGVDNGTRPSDDVLRSVLHDFARRRLSVDKRLAELASKHGYSIKKSKLAELNKEFQVPSPRKPVADGVATALIAEHLEQDIGRRHGPARVQQKVLLKHGVALSRYQCRKIQHKLDPDGAEARFPHKGRREKKRGQLTAVGIMQEVHCDGHEKLGGIALRLGDVGFGIYGFHCHTGKVLHVDVVPNDRNPLTVAHCYLDFVRETGEISLQLTFDGGTETGYMAAIQTELRCNELSELDRPATRSLKSTDNIPAESMWSYWLEDEGANLKTVLLQGHDNGLFAPGNPLHVHLFQWLWSRIIRNHLLQFKDYFNSTRRRSQKNKLLPTDAPNEVFAAPEEYGLEKLGIGIPREVVEQFRARLPLSREHVMRWVPDEFDEIAQYYYEEIGSPQLEHTFGWEIYRQMLPLILEAYM